MPLIVGKINMPEVHDLTFQDFRVLKDDVSYYNDINDIHLVKYLKNEFFPYFGFVKREDLRCITK